MNRRFFLRNIAFVSAGLSLPFSKLFARFYSIRQPLVRGKITTGGKGLPNVWLSDGYEMVQTNAKGEYSLQPHSQAGFVFVILPAGYGIPQTNGLASFYAAIDGSKKEQVANFSLEPLPQSDDRHAFIIWGDTQIWDKEDARQLKEISAPETKRVIASLGNQPVHGIALGDLVFDKFDLFPDYKAAVAQTGIPFFQLLGNHDMDISARTDELSQETYKKHFGPTYYSFNRGKIHYVVLDDVFLIGGQKRYIGYLPENQLSWLEKDLAQVPAGSTVVVSVHIPTNNGDKRRKKAGEESPSGVVSNREALYRLLKPYNAHIMSAHTHYNENWVEGNLMEHNHATVCGAWWSGPVCNDGTPPSIGVYQADGDKLSWYLHPVGGKKEEQLRVYAPGKSADRPGHVVANVWNWDPAWKVEWLKDGQEMGIMEQFTGQDPLAKELYEGPSLPAKHKWVEPNLTDHLFSAFPGSGAKEIEVRVTDRFGSIYREKIKIK